YIIIAVLILLVVALLGVSAWGYTQYTAKEDYYNYINNQVHQDYYELVASVETISSELSKLMVSNQTKENMVLFSKVWQNAYNAGEYLAKLPITNSDIGKSEKFLNQLGDYTFAMAQKSVKGEHLDSKDIDNLEQLYQYSNQLVNQLRETKDETLGDDKWKSAYRREKNFRILKSKTEEKEEPNVIEAQFTQFEERLTEYPELIYDGPFSEDVFQGANPKLRGEEIDQQQAEEKVKAILGEQNISEIKKEDGAEGKIKLYSFIVKVKGHERPIYMDISVIKGYLVSILNNRDVEKSELSKKEAIDTANKYLEEKGFPGMIPTYSLKTDNTIVINYAYSQEDVMMYPDLIKVKVAMDNGEIVGFDSSKFLTTNEQRSIHPPALTPDEAKQAVSVRATIIDEPKLCYIPKSSNGEIYCYEIKVDRGEEHFLIYINADTGMEEKILKTIISENGVLMI
ncbi:MAG: germination protein YpeB, partial [Peptostreptococcales bacterium]